MKNRLICADNMDALRTIGKESIDLIYIDPPFFSHRQYEVIWGDEGEVRSFEDRWEGGINVYIEWMRPRVEELYRVLKPTGSFYLHCDWHANAHLRIMLDEIFGEKNFRNEIVWCYDKWISLSKAFRRNHDIIFRYSKTSKDKFNIIREIDEKRQKTLDRGYTTNLLNNGERQLIVYKGSEHKENIKVLIKKKKFVRVLYREPEGNPIKDWWVMNIIHPKAKERQGYPTQKPEALLERIIRASSKKGDVVLDAFCGCGTTLVVAHKLRRNWIGIDISSTAVKVMKDRLRKIGDIKDSDYIITGMPITIGDLRELKPFEFQNWVIHEMGARQSRKKVGDFGIDGYFIKDLWHNEAGIQVKQSSKVGRNVIDNFETALKRKKYKEGYIVAFSFTKGACEEAARVKNQEELEIKLIKVEELLYKKKPIL